ncbi:MAG: hypothetical protein ACOYOS_12245 [Syntrophales bacterium]
MFKDRQDQEYMKRIREMALHSPPTAFSARLPIGNTTYQLAVIRNKDPLPWPTLDDVVAFGDRPIAGEDQDLLLLYANSFFTAHELIGIADFFFDNYGSKFSDVQALDFPLPLPFALSYVDFEGDTGLEEVSIGDRTVLPPLSLLALYSDVAGGSAAWHESGFGEFFGWAERHGSGVHSFILPAGEVLKDVEIRGYSQPSGKCFLDEIKGVHVKEVRETIEP